MTEYRRDREPINFFSEHPLTTRDSLAFLRLSEEIRELEQSGHEISVGDTPDRAYETPERIGEMYDYLHERDLALEAARMQVLAEGIGGLGINPLKRNYRRQKGIYERLEPVRDRLLFSEQESDSRPWHRQRGRATALLTIAAAHELDASDGGVYPTMSGPLDAQVLDYRFPTTGTTFDGLPLHQAVVQSEVKYGSKDHARAEATATKRLNELEEFVLSPVSPKFKEIVRFCSDSLGIRSRKQEVNNALREHIERTGQKSKSISDMLMMSYGCGTALPLLELLAEIKYDTGSAPRLILIDQDPIALAAAAALAEKMALAEHIEIHCRQLFDRLFRPLPIDEVLRGRSLDVVEDSGLREYLPDTIYRKLTKMTWDHLAAGGLMSTGNMNRNRPQAEFLHGMMGWQPEVQMRTIEQGFRLHESAGIPRGATTARVTRDGVYTLYFSKK